MIAEQLKKSILQAAIQGKLTEQLPEDGDARDLLKEIQKEKQRLIKEGKIKKDKPLPEITEDEIPFEIPANWCWVRLGNLSFDHGQKKPDKDFTYIDISSIDNIGYKLGSTNCVLKPGEAPSRARKVVKEGDVIYSTVRPYLHNVCTIDRIIDPEPIVSTGFAVVCTPMLTLNKYLFYFLLSPMFDSYVTDSDNTKGVAYPAINGEKFSNAPVPLPPISEQFRIVDRLEEVLPVIDKLAGDEINLDKLLMSFPKKMKDAVLQAAIQGKLTKQLPEDGDARDLLKEIQKEKQRLIREGKIKKDKPLPEIAEDEIPFEIPANWCWVRLVELGAPCDYPFADGPFGSNLKTEHYTDKHEVRIIQLSNIGNNGWRDENTKYTTYAHLQTIARSEVKAGDIVIAKMMPAGRAIEVPDIEKSYVLSSDAIKFVPNTAIDKKYILHAINSDTFRTQITSEVHGITRVRTSMSKVRTYIVPIPPLSEQHRIIERLEEVLPVIDKLEKSRS